MMVRVTISYMCDYCFIAFTDINIFFFYTDEEDLCSNCPGDTAGDHE